MKDDAHEPPPIVDVEDESVSVRMIGPDDWDTLREAMSNGAGLIRSEGGLERLQETVSEIADRASGDLRAAALAARLICDSALARDESRGVHFRLDAPEPSTEWDGRHVATRRED
jgi:L-aspartate oxidase